MASDGDKETIRVPRVDRDIRDLLPVAETKMRPGLPGVHRLVDAIADGEVRPSKHHDAANIQHIRVRWRDDERADRSGRLTVKDWSPGASGISGFPDAAIADANVKGVRLAGMSCSRLGPSGAQRTNVAPPHFGEQLLIDWPGGPRSLCDGPRVGSGTGGKCCRRNKERANSSQAGPPRRVYFNPPFRLGSHQRGRTEHSSPQSERSQRSHFLFSACSAASVVKPSPFPPSPPLPGCNSSHER